VLDTYSDTDFGKAGKHHADALNQVWNKEITKHNDYALILDGDIFLLDNFNITTLLSKNKPMFGVPQHRGIFNYISPTVVGMDLSNIMMIEDIDWEGREIVPNVHLDTGGGLHPWCHAGAVRPLSNTWHIKADNKNLHTLPDAVMTAYQEGFDVELYEDLWLHYCASSGWKPHETEKFHKEKTNWVQKLIDKRLSGVVLLKYTGFNTKNDWLGWV
jgi:hypothetical protein